MTRGAQLEPSFWKDKSVVVTGGTGFLGRAVIMRLLEGVGASARATRGSSEHDLRDAAAAREAVSGADVVIHLAARVGGIGYNRRNPAPLRRTTSSWPQRLRRRARRGREARHGRHASAPTRSSPRCRSRRTNLERLSRGANAPYGLAKRCCSVARRTYRRQTASTASCR